MAIIIQLPEEIEKQLEATWSDLARRTLEALALEGYFSGDLSAGQVALMLSLSVWETEWFLKEREAYLHYSLNDLRRDVEAQERVL